MGGKPHTSSNVSFEDGFSRPEPPKPPRDALGRIKKGHSLNPGGRPKGRAELYREACDEVGVIQRMAAVASGKEDEEGKPSRAQQIDAIKWLEDRAYGKATEKHVNIDATPSNALVVDADTLTLEQKQLLLEFARKQAQIAEVIEGDFRPAIGPGTDPKDPEASNG